MLNLFNTGSHKAERAASVATPSKLISGIFVDLSALFPWTLSSHINEGLMAALVDVQAVKPVTLIGDTRDFDYSAGEMARVVSLHKGLSPELAGVRVMGRDELEPRFGPGYKLETVITPYIEFPDQRAQMKILSRNKGVPILEQSYYTQQLRKLDPAPQLTKLVL